MAERPKILSVVCPSHTSYCLSEHTVCRTFRDACPGETSTGRRVLWFIFSALGRWGLGSIVVVVRFIKPHRSGPNEPGPEVIQRVFGS